MMEMTLILNVHCAPYMYHHLMRFMLYLLHCKVYLRVPDL